MPVENNSIRWIDPFDYKQGEPFRVMPVGTFKRGQRTLTITKADLEAMAANAQGGNPRWAIPIYFGHPTDTNPDPPTVGNAKKLFVKDDGLYAVPEWSADGEKAVKDGAYQFVSPGVLWSKNGSEYTDDQGNKHDNVVDHIALTNKPFFGKHTALFSEPGVLDNFQMDSGTKTNHMLKVIRGLAQSLLTALDVAKEVDPDEDGDDDTHVQVVNETPVDKAPDNGPIPAVPPTVAKGAPVDVTDLGVMKNQLPPPADYAVLIDGKWQMFAAKDLPAIVPCPKCDKPMPKGTKCPGCGYEAMDDADGDADEDTMSVNAYGEPAELFKAYDTQARQDLAKKGEAMPDGSYPIANGADLENAIHAIGRGGASHAQIRNFVIKRAKALGLSDKLPPDWEGSTKENNMSDPTPKQETFAVTAEEFNAIKAKAEKAAALEEQMTAMKTQADTFAAQLAAERKSRRVDTLAAEYDGFSVPMGARDLAEHFQALEERDPDAFKYFDGLVKTMDTAIKQGALFSQFARQNAAQTNQADTFEAAIDKTLKDKFGGDASKYSEAAGIAAKEHPDLYREYKNDYSANRK